jgi:hypothetical protein
MMPSPLRQVFTLMLAIFVSVGMGLSVVQASCMTVKMAATTEMGAPGQSDCPASDGADMAKSKSTVCPACDGAGMAKSKSAVCMAICVGTVAFAPVPAVALAAVVQAETRASLPETALLSGSSFPPDPYPPRSSDIG